MPRLEVWSHPEDSFRRLLILEPPSAVLTDTDTANDTATLSLPASWCYEPVDTGSGVVTRFDLLLKVDPVDPGTAKRSLVAFYMDGSTVPDLEFFVEEATEVLTDSGQGEIVFSGPVVLAGLDSATVYPRTQVEGRWLWGSDANLLRNPGFEVDGFPNGSFELGLDPWQGTQDREPFTPGTVQPAVGSAMGGTHYGAVTPTGADSGAEVPLPELMVGQVYTVTGQMLDPANTGYRFRAGVNGAVNGTHTNAYSEDGWIWAEVDNAVQGSGVSDGTIQDFTLTFEAADPTPRIVVVCADNAGPGFYIGNWQINGPGIGLSPWEPWSNPAAATVDMFDRTTPGLTGSGSLLFQGTDVLWCDSQGSCWYGQVGFQQPFVVVPGRQYFAQPPTFYHEDGSARRYAVTIVRRVLTGPAASTQYGFQGGSHLTWRTFDVPSHTVFTPPAFTFTPDVEQVGFRVTFVGSGGQSDVGPVQSPVTEIDEAGVFEGWPKATVGEILLALFEPVHARGVLTWVEFGFTATHDSDGNPWDEPIAFSADVGESFATHVVNNLKAYGYRFALTRETVLGATTHRLDAWNPGVLGSAENAVVVGSVEGGTVAKRWPAFTHLLVEAADGSVTEVTLPVFAGLVRNEGFYRAVHALNSAAAVRVGETILADQVADMVAVQTRLGPSVVPYRDFRHGWSLPHDLGFRGGRHDRTVSTITSRLDSGVWSFETTASRLLDGDAARDSLLIRLVDQFHRRDRVVAGGTVIPNAVPVEGGGAPTVVVAAVDSSDVSKGKADFVCDGVDDHVEIQAALDLANSEGSGGRVILCEGFYSCAETLVLPGRGVLEGTGREQTTLNSSASPAVTGSAFSAPFTLRNLRLSRTGGTAVQTVNHGGVIEDCWITGSPALTADNGAPRIYQSLLQGTVDITSTANIHISDTTFHGTVSLTGINRGVVSDCYFGEQGGDRLIIDTCTQINISNPTFLELLF